MNVTLPEKLEAWIEAQVRAGHYQDVNEIVQIGLERLIERNEKLEALQAAIQLGIDDSEAGRVYRFDTAEELREAVHKRIREREQTHKK